MTMSEEGGGALDSTDFIRDIGSLPPEAQKQVSDFVSFLETRYPVAQTGRKAKRTRLANEPFIGMWRDRQEMKDSSAWVWRVRESEWAA